MLEHISLENFKCFRKKEIAFNALTLLTGVNSSGKSSVIQALLMMQQTFAERRLEPEARLSGELVNLGLPDDVLYTDAEKDGFAICLKKDALLFEMSASLDRGGIKTVCTPNANVEFSEFYYLDAERICPRTMFPIPTETQQYYNPVGNHGEYAAYLLHSHGDEHISCGDQRQVNLLAPDNAGPSPCLLQQTEAWLSLLGSPLRLRTERPTGTDAVVLRFSFPDISGAYYRPTNVGFGLTYALPVFVAALAAKPGALLIVENPEAHLHPKGQALMGRFLSRAAACGVQVIVETHSDHVLNGIRLAVKKQEISPARVQINFFERDESGVRVHTPRIDQDGHIDEWPEDFFDEWEKNLVELL